MYSQYCVRVTIRNDEERILLVESVFLVPKIIVLQGRVTTKTNKKSSGEEKHATSGDSILFLWKNGSRKINKIKTIG